MTPLSKKLVESHSDQKLAEAGSFRKLPPHKLEWLMDQFSSGEWIIPGDKSGDGREYSVSSDDDGFLLFSPHVDDDIADVEAEKWAAAGNTGEWTYEMLDKRYRIVAGRNPGDDPLVNDFLEQLAVQADNVGSRGTERGIMLVPAPLKKYPS